MLPQAHITGSSRSAMRIGGVLCVLLMSGCAGIGRSTEREATPVAASPDAIVSIAPRRDPTAPPPEQLQSTTVEREAVTSEKLVPPAAQSASGAAGRVAAKPAVATPKALAKPASSLPPAAQLPKKETPALALAKPEAAPPLDLKSLETRLKETRAIGVFTKLTLKNQVDDLLGQFRAYYQGTLKASMAELRRSYDLLVLKVLALLQDADPPLANAIALSRESIWGILSNPAKFAAV